MIYLTGDTHGRFERIGIFCDKMQTSRDDILIILGDAGINFHAGALDILRKEYLAKLPITLLCIHGNHEQRPTPLMGYQRSEYHGGAVWVEPQFPNIVFAIDGEVYDFCGHSCLVIGGAYSVDKRHRLANGHLWFPDEQLTEAEKEHVEQALDRRHWRIDTVLSHTCPAAFVPQEALLPSIDQSTVDTSIEDWLQRIEQRLRYRRWYCGHFHIEKQEGRLRFLHKDIVPL